MASGAEIAAMRQAIMLSALGLGTTSPNPPVGCVILDSRGRVAGTGYHRRKGEAHAEVNALSVAGAAARGGTAVVTLEPCNHVGVTAACRQALVDAGIARVVIGLIDPTSRGDGGAAVLTAAGVDVEVGVLADEVLTVLRPWLTATARGEPYVTWAYSVGSGETDSALLPSLRSNADLIVTGTLIDEGILGGHSDRHFHLADLQPFEEQPDVWLPAAYKAGVRSILVLGQSRVAAALQAADAIDSLIIAVPRDNSEAAILISAASPAFEIVDIAGWNGFLLTRLRHSPTTIPPKGDNTEVTGSIG